MTLEEIAKYRLFNQQLISAGFISPKDVVGWLGAMQAQDYEMAKWAIGIRLPGVTAQAVEMVLDKGEIIRTHLLRPTWHLVAAHDLRWMLALSAPQQRKLVNNFGKKLALAPSVFNRCNRIIEKSLSVNSFLTRKEIILELQKQHIDTNDLRANLIIMQAELEGIICSGPRRGKQLTYALLEERVPPTPSLSREEALAALAERYFTSHGPATLYDFAWWSGLSLTDARHALESVKSFFEPVQLHEQMYWFKPAALPGEKGFPQLLLLPAFDEFLVSYKDRSASLKPSVSKEIITKNGIFRPVMVMDGQVTGSWRRTTKSNKALLETYAFEPMDHLQEELVGKAVDRYRSFLEMEVIIP